MDITLQPIGIFRGQQKERYQVTRQGGLIEGLTGAIELFPGNNFEQALEGVDGFGHVWVIYQFHRNKKWKPKVFPPRGNSKQGVFSTRSPHRPNFIGLSRVKLIDVKGLVLMIEDHDLIDGTPILDIKPYINYCDGVPSQRQGWLDDLEEIQNFEISWSQKAQDQAAFLLNESVDIKSAIRPRLSTNPFPRKSNRIKKLGESEYVVAYKSWRILYEVQIDLLEVRVHEIQSGYQELNEVSSDRWGDVDTHRRFIDQFEFPGTPIATPNRTQRSFRGDLRWESRSE